ncbi:hypothetical protein [Aeoliella mucimassa]|uniref:Carboxypeptidase regulatory-like domain-containing protein n=1 Tax=Aeoliella mucimassa TaxID=2527972 RepID=A0A518AMG7_9BACT|nr:hypothetical protein [Aeoliella mucimassa]QDU55903.1 hypothetical protein Pan181_21050 [Aeoliella mucimassa]
MIRRLVSRRLALSMMGCVVLSLLMVGCKSKDDSMGSVHGIVRVDGNPPSKGSIIFAPRDGKARTAGTKIEDGHYEAEVPIGTAKVAIRIPQKVGERKASNAPNSPMVPIIEDVLPPKYNEQTELEVDVKPGSNEFSFDLSSK